MPHIALPEGLPGITSAFAFRPETAAPMGALAEVLLRGPNSLTSAEREMIATYVSSENDCYYCQHCHGSIAAQHLGGSDDDYEFITRLKQDFESTNVSAKMKALLNIAGKVQTGGKHVTTADVDRARREGATDKEIHDTVLIAAAFCIVEISSTVNRTPNSSSNASVRSRCVIESQPSTFSGDSSAPIASSGS